jgi:hypothetical protein
MSGPGFSRQLPNPEPLHGEDFGTLKGIEDDLICPKIAHDKPTIVNEMGCVHMGRLLPSMMPADIIADCLIQRPVINKAPFRARHAVRIEPKQTKTATTIMAYHQHPGILRKFNMTGIEAMGGPFKKTLPNAAGTPHKTHQLATGVTTNLANHINHRVMGMAHQK